MLENDAVIPYNFMFIFKSISGSCYLFSLRYLEKITPRKNNNSASLNTSEICTSKQIIPYLQYSLFAIIPYLQIIPY